MREFIAAYLSEAHRDDVAGGCVMSALGPELARADASVRATFIEAYRAFVDRWQALATLVGALVISRATAGDPLSDEVLASARSVLLAGDGVGEL